MPNNIPEEDNLFTPHRTNDIFSDQPPSEQDLFPHYGSPEGDLFPELRITKEDLQGIKSFADEQNIDPIDKKRLISYYRDIDLRQKKRKKRVMTPFFNL